MSFPNYALFYFPDSDIVKVDSTDIILREHRLAEYVVSSREQLRSEEGYVEVRMSSRSRHGQTKTLPAKILLVSGKLMLSIRITSLGSRWVYKPFPTNTVWVVSC